MRQLRSLHPSARPLLAAALLATAVPTARAQSVLPPPDSAWRRARPAEMGMDSALLAKARDFALQSGGSGYVTRGGKLVMSWGDERERYDLKSSTKSIGVTALGLALRDGKMALNDPVAKHHAAFGVPPESNAATGWLPRVTLLHLANQTAGFAKRGDYQPLLFEPGTRWHYSDGGPNWLAEAVTLAYGRDVEELMFERVFTPIGITREDLRWRENMYRPHEIEGIKRREFGSGVHANVNAMARIGYLYLRGGRWGEKQILPASFVELVSKPHPAIRRLPVHEDPAHARGSDHYSMLWWNNGDEALEGLPMDMYWSWGLHESLILVIPSLDIVVARAGKQGWQQPGRPQGYPALRPFIEPIVQSVRAGSRGGLGIRAPYAQSPVIRGLSWAPADSVIRQAKGSDNWPMTWADDGHLYTAWGDGWGFEPFLPEKLSMGIARIEGTPPAFRGINIPAPTVEDTGGGRAGRKASGMLMVDGVLYMWVRNADLSRLAWSKDHGRSWTWADWKFTEGFAAPTFLNFGQNYAGARDGYVYTYSHDAPSAYYPADRAILARVPKDRITDRAAWEFLKEVRPGNVPVWTNEIAERGAVFSFPGMVYRSGISYNAGLKRYIWYQLLPDLPGETRYEGGLGVYDAPEPWGPWTTVYFTERWDSGPGDTGSFPTKWMSADGRTMWLASAGDDYLSVRRATLRLAPRVRK